jgi:hypothetical protein
MADACGGCGGGGEYHRREEEAVAAAGEGNSFLDYLRFWMSLSREYYRISREEFEHASATK